MDSLTTQGQEIQFKSFVLKENGLEIIGEPSFDEWIECGNFIKRAKGAVHFWIGDWLNFGERSWGEKYKEAIEMTGFDYGTLRNDKWVTSQIPSERRKERLSFDHHYTVANLDEEQQDELLQKAASENLNTKDFRKVVDGDNLSWRHDKDTIAIPEIKIDTNEQVDELLKAGLILYNLIDATDFNSLSDSEKVLIFSSLNSIKDKIVALEIKYD